MNATPKSTTEATPMERDHNQEHELMRERLARQGYINWRMRDVPVIYQELMPYSYKLRDLMKAERAIRAQMKVDAKLVNSPWREVGPACNLLDREGVSGVELVGFGLEMQPHVGMPAPVRAGLEDHPEVVAIQNSPEYQDANRKAAEENQAEMKSLGIPDDDEGDAGGQGY